MYNSKVLLIVILLTSFLACTKENPVSDATKFDNKAESLQKRAQPITIFGLASERPSDDEKKSEMEKAGVDIIRLGISLAENTINKKAESYLTEGYKVQFLVNWYDDKNGERIFPKNKKEIKKQAEAFFKNYADRKAQIPFVVVENEWDYQVLHGANLQDYLQELSIITAAGHKYGFMIADGGITSSSLQRWTYSQLEGVEQAEWRTKYFVGLHKDYDELVDMVNTYLQGAKNINFDYSNVHWYNSIICGNGFETATNLFVTASNKKQLVCNEFGIRTNSLKLFTQTKNEIYGNALYAIAYSGSNISGKAIKLTDAMLNTLK